MNALQFKETFPSKILKKNKYYFLEYFNKSFSKRKLLTKFKESIPIEDTPFADIHNFTDKPIECLYFTNATNVKTGRPFSLDDRCIKLYYFDEKLYAENEFHLINIIVTQWNFSSKLTNYRLNESFLYIPMAQEIVLKKILNDPNFLWNN